MELDTIFATASFRAFHLKKFMQNLFTYESRHALFDDRFGPTFIAGASLLTIFIFILALFCHRTPTYALRKHSESLNTLLLIFTPTRTSWPSNYARLLPHCTSRTFNLNVIRLPISTVLHNISQGTIELRDSHDLCQLFCRDLRAYGWSIRFFVGLSQRTSVFRWLVVSHMPLFHPRIELSGLNLKRSPIERQMLPNIADTSIFPHHRRLTSFPAALEDLNTVIDLDFVPYSALEWTLRAVRSQLQPECSASVEFTTTAAHIAFLSDGFIFCALPFMSQKSFLGGTARRTTTPILISLHRVTEYLTSGAPNTKIRTITNITSERITALRVLHQNLVTDRVLRSALIQKWGEQGWREHRFMVSWEAELLAAGLLSRWVIVIRK